MDDAERLHKAQLLLEEAYEAHMGGDLDRAIVLYRRSIRYYPTSEAHTFLGWSYSLKGLYPKAIDECQKAIALDPDFGNPWNDIGVYLIEQDQLDEAIPYLVQAIGAKRYEARAFPHFNLGRVFLQRGEWDKAREQFQKALVIDPEYEAAREALELLEENLH